MVYLVAVSGGVDSVVLLDMLSKTDHQLIVAHVDHGIREDSAADARFVEALAMKYALPFVSTRFELGVSASEEVARQARYGFLFSQATKYKAQIITAHHQGDVLETIAINLSRGTGWRGLAVLNREGIVRPLLGLDKSKLYEYALKHRLEWVEDSTNASDRYQRNRIRRAINISLTDDQKRQLSDLRSKQLLLCKSIGFETQRINNTNSSRHFFLQIDAQVASELLGTMIADVSGIRPTRPQLNLALLAIKTAKPRTVHQIGSRIQLRFTSRKFEIEVV